MASFAFILEFGYYRWFRWKAMEGAAKGGIRGRWKILVINFYGSGISTRLAISKRTKTYIT